MNCDNIIRNKINELLWNLNKTKDFSELKSKVLVLLNGTRFVEDLKLTNSKNEIKTVVRKYFHSISNYELFVREMSRFEEALLPENEAYSAYKYFLYIISRCDNNFSYNKNNKFINDYVCQIRTEYLNPQYTVWTEGFKTVAPDLIVDYVDNYHSYIELNNYLNSEINKSNVDDVIILDSLKFRNYMNLVLKRRIFGIEHFQVCYYSSINNNGLLMDETKRCLNSSKKLTLGDKFYDVFTSSYHGFINHLDSFDTYEFNINEFIKLNPFESDGLYFLIEMSDVEIKYTDGKLIPIYLTEDFVDIIRMSNGDKVEKLKGFMCVSSNKSYAWMHDIDYILKNYVKKGDYLVNYTGGANQLKSKSVLCLEDYLKRSKKVK